MPRATRFIPSVLVPALLTAACALPAFGDIQRWDDHTVIPGTEGVTVGPNMKLGTSGAGMPSAYGCAQLDGVNLKNLQIGNADFSQAKFDGSNMEGAWVFGSTLTLASLAGANLFNAKLEGTNFTNANLSNVNLAHGSFYRFEALPFAASAVTPIAGGGTISTANLTNANLSNAVLEDVDFRAATLTGATFTGATIRGATFTNVTGFTSGQFYSTKSYATHDLAGTTFLNKAMVGWNFSKLYLVNATISTAGAEGNLSWANFSGACLAFAAVDAANLSGANLQGADFTQTRQNGSILRSADLRNAIGWVQHDNSNVTNLIRPDGTVLGLRIEDGEKFRVRNSVVPVTVKTAASLTDNAIIEFQLADGWTSQVKFDKGVVPSLDGTLSLRLAPGADTDAVVGQKFKLFDWGTLLGAGNRFAAVTLAPGLTFDLANLYTTGEVTLTAVAGNPVEVPEPMTAAVLGTGGALLLKRRRRAG
jgi:uncharacterized protein YjbI with pentapeptide repeats